MISTFGDAFEVDPKVRIAKNTEVPFVEMADIEPWNRSAHAKGRKKFSGGSKFLDGDVLVARITPSLENGKTSIYKADQLDKNTPAGGSTEFIIVRGIPGKSISEFAYYLLRTADLRAHLIANMNGSSGRQRVQADALRNYVVDLPSIEEQQRIAGVLGALDDKIESNRQVCSLIDLLATELFCDRFTVHTRGGTSDLMTIGDIGEIVGGGTPSKKVEEYYADSGIAWLTPRDLSKDRSIFRQHGEFDISELGLRKSSARLLPRGTVLFTSRAPIGYIAIASGETSTNQGFKSIVPHSNFGTPFTFYLLKQLTPEIVTSANGSTFKEISKSGLAKVSFKSPSTEAVQAFNATIQPLLDLQEVKEIENCQLSQLRDTLLPELMSGRMRVDKAGCLVSEALDEEVADV